MKKAFLIMLVLSQLILIGTAYAATLAPFDGGLAATGGAMGFSGTTVSVPLTERLGSYLAVALSFIGVIFLLLAIYGGFLWMTAQGDKGQVEKAKNMITQAAVGLIIIVSAYAITSFIGGFASGVSAPAVTQ